MKPTTIDPHDLLERKEELLRRRLLHTIDELEAKGRIRANTKLLLPLLVGIGSTVLVWSGWKQLRRRRRWHRLLH